MPSPRERADWRKASDEEAAAEKKGAGGGKGREREPQPESGGEASERPRKF